MMPSGQWYAVSSLPPAYLSTSRENTLCISTQTVPRDRRNGHRRAVKFGVRSTQVRPRPARQMCRSEDRRAGAGEHEFLDRLRQAMPLVRWNLARRAVSPMRCKPSTNECSS